MTDTLRRILYPVFVLTVIATIWTMGWAKARNEQAERRYWPARHPNAFQLDEPAGTEASVSLQEL